jgi:hypothetical protein
LSSALAIPAVVTACGKGNQVLSLGDSRNIGNAGLNRVAGESEIPPLNHEIARGNDEVALDRTITAPYVPVVTPGIATLT